MSPAVLGPAPRPSDADQAARLLAALERAEASSGLRAWAVVQLWREAGRTVKAFDAGMERVYAAIGGRRG